MVILKEYQNNKISRSAARPGQPIAAITHIAVVTVLRPVPHPVHSVECTGLIMVMLGTLAIVCPVCGVCTLVKDLCRCVELHVLLEGKTWAHGDQI